MSFRYHIKDQSSMIVFFKCYDYYWLFWGLEGIVVLSREFHGIGVKGLLKHFLYEISIKNIYQSPTPFYLIV